MRAARISGPRARPAPSKAGIRSNAASGADHRGVRASVTIDPTEAGAAGQQDALMLQERDRIAADLQDVVIQRLFATSLSLQSTAARMPAGHSRDRVQAAVADIDDTITGIRATIFGLRRHEETALPGVRSRMLEVVNDAARVLGFAPDLRFSGILENVLPEPVIEDLLAVLAEALSNIARHAEARTVTVSASTGGGRLTLEPTGTRLSWFVPI